MFKKDTAEGTMCPLLSKACIETKCMFWTKIIGMNPQTEDQIDHWGCAVAWLPILLIEGSQMSRQSGAAVESMRNEIVKRMDNSNPMIQALAEENARLKGPNGGLG